MATLTLGDIRMAAEGLPDDTPVHLDDAGGIDEFRVRAMWFGRSGGVATYCETREAAEAAVGRWRRPEDEAEVVRVVLVDDASMLWDDEDDGE